MQSFSADMMLLHPQETHGLGLTEIALRWCQHHSALTPTDGIILGASSAAQLEQNLTDRHAFVSIFDVAWY